MDAVTSSVDGDKKNLFAWIVLFFLVALASAERTYGIDRQSLWNDELFAVIASHKPFFGGAWKMMLSDSHPPGYLSFMYVTLPITGYSDFGVRAHALIFGLLWIPLVYLLAKRWFSVSASLLAVAVIASAYNAVYYSQEARAYTMLVAFSLVNVICLFEILFAEQYKRRHSIGFVVATVAILYLHYSGFVLVCAEMLLCGLLLLSKHCQPRLKTLLWIFAVPFLVYSPWLGIMYKNMVDAPSQWAVSATPSPETVKEVLRKLIGVGAKNVVYHYLVLLFLLVYVVVRWARKGLSQEIVIICSLLFLMAAPIVAFYIKSSIGTPIFVHRYFLFSSVIWSILLGYCIGKVISLFGNKPEYFLVTIAILAYSYIAIKGNISQELYSRNNKVPIREAASLAKEDIKQHASADYAILVSHRGFDHYLRAQGIAYDDRWPGRVYVVSQNIGVVDEYLAKHSSVKYLYYLVIRDANTEKALVPLKIQYKLISQRSLPFDHGAGYVDVFKFSTEEFPSNQQLDSVGTNATNELARLIAKDVEAKDPSTYDVLMTHKWMYPYLRYNGVAVDDNWGRRQYLAAIQTESVFDYIKTHPAIQNLYYLAFQEPTTEGAELMLQLRYQLVSKTTMDSAAGKISLLKYSTKEQPITEPDTVAHMKTSPMYRMIEWFASRIDQAHIEKYAFAETHSWIGLYLKQGLAPTAEAASWLSANYAYPAQAENLFAYINNRAVERLYYVALREPRVEEAVNVLKNKYSLEDRQSFDIAGGTIDVYQFKVVK